jgi:DNA-binding NarL/FixJ family response regulator
MHDEHVVRDALCALLQRAGLEPVIACTPSEIHAVVRQPGPSVLLLALCGNVAHDDVLLRAAASLSVVKTIVVLADTTVQSDIARARRLPRCLVLEDRSGGELVAVVAAACSEGRPSPEGTQEAGAVALATLTFAERRVVSLIGRGLTVGEIASTVHIAEADARECLFNILDRMGMSDRVQLAAYLARRSSAPAL